MTPIARRLVLAAAGVAALGAGASWRLWRTRDAGSSAGASGGDEAADDFWALELPTPSGASLAMKALQGRPLVVNFWASWCPPCIKEMPDLDRFAKDFAGQGWQVLGIAIDQAEPVQRFLKETPVSFPIVLAGNEGLSWVRRLGNPAGGLPFSVQMDANGRIARRKLGATTFDELAGWARATR
jgi:thiol-disulfide isomerase/thioredoxin